MIGTTRQVQVWACAEPVSMHKGFDGLFGIARNAMGRDPLAGDLYLFVARNRRRTRNSSPTFTLVTGFIFRSRNSRMISIPWLVSAAGILRSKPDWSSTK